MRWLKAAWTPLAAAGLAFMAIMATMSAARHKATADKWRAHAVDIEEGNVKDGLTTAAAANSQAKMHDVRADERKKAAEDRITKIGAGNESIADILDNWRKS